MTLMYCFPSFLITENLTNIDNNDLARYAVEYQKNFPGVVKSNYGGWQSDRLEVHNDNVGILVDEIIKICNDHKKDFCIKSAGNFFVSNIWLNINGKGTFNRPHIHSECLFSGVYYVKCQEDSGNVILLNPSKLQQYHVKEEYVESFDGILASTWSVDAEIGKLLIFPAWLEHYVEPNRSDEDRISIAFNINLG